MIRRRELLTGLSGLGAGAVVGAFSGVARAQDGPFKGTRENVAILGTGRLGGTLGRRLTALQFPVIFGSRTADGAQVAALLKQCGPLASAASLKDAAAGAAIIVFALPWEPVKALLPGLGDLSGKLIIDPMNTQLKIVDGYPSRSDAPTSVSEALQSWLPGARVVKAFNTIWYKDLADPGRAGGPISIPLAGADRGAKDRVAHLVSELGLEPVDVGPLIAARYVEDLLRFEVGNIMYNKGKVFEIYMRCVQT